MCAPIVLFCVEGICIGLEMLIQADCIRLEGQILYASLFPVDGRFDAVYIQTDGYAVFLAQFLNFIYLGQDLGMFRLSRNAERCRKVVRPDDYDIDAFDIQDI